MLLKPVNPSPVHTAIDIAQSNILSCEVDNRNIAMSRFCVYDSDGATIYQNYGEKTDFGLKCVLPSKDVVKDLYNDGDFSWDVSYWSKLPEPDKSAVVVSSIQEDTSVQAGDTSLFISGYAKYELKGINVGYSTTGTSQISWENGFFMSSFYNGNYMQGQRAYVYLIPPSGGDLSIFNNAVDLVFRDVNKSVVAKARTISAEIATIYGIRCWKIFVDYAVYGYYPDANSTADVRKWGGVEFSENLCDTCAIYQEYTADVGVGDLLIQNSIPYKITNIDLQTDRTYIALDAPLLSEIASNSSVDIVSKNKAEYTVSSEYYFRARPTPSFNFAGSFGNSISDIGYTLPRHFNTFFIEYTGVDLGEYQITVSAENKKGNFVDIYKTDIVYNPVFEAHNTYGEVLRFVYDGFVSGVTYKIEVTGKTVEGDIVTPIQTIFDVEYSTNTSSDITLEGRGCYTDIKLSNPWERDGKQLQTNNTLIIYRKSRDGLCLQKVCEGEMSSLEDLGGYKYHIKDYNIASHTEYTYYFAVRSTETEDYQYNSGYYLGFPIYESQPVNAYIDEHFVVGLSYNDKDGYVVDKNNVWSFGLNTEIGAYKHNYDKTTFDSFGKYATLSVGNRNYVDFSLSALLGDVTCDSEYYDDVDMINSWDAFCASPSIKLYKEPKGRIMLVETTGMETENSIISNELPTIIKSNLVQIGDTNNTQIYTWELMA